MIKNIKQIFCNHGDRYSFRKYGDFDFIEYYVCNNCGKILDSLTGFDEDLRG